jgi:hypothetical protein
MRCIQYVILVCGFQSKLSSELDNKQTLDEMDKILENLQSWRNKHPEDGSSDVHMDSDSEEDEEYRVQLQLYQQHRNQHDDGDDKKQDLDEKEDFEEEEPLTARLANEHTVNAPPFSILYAVSSALSRCLILLCIL